MRRLLTGAATLAAAVMLSAAPAAAQSDMGFFVGGGLNLPSSDFGDAFKSGWVANAGLSFFSTAEGRAKLWLEGLYTQNKFDDGTDDKSTIIGGLGSLTYNLTTGSTTTPYLIGSVGFLSQKTTDSDSDESSTESGIGFGGGAGISFGKFYVEGRYLTASLFDNVTTAFIMATVGITF